MKDILLFLMAYFIISFSTKSYCQIIDEDGREYGTTIINNKIWTTENSNRNQYNNGDFIVEAKSIEQWVELCDQKIGAWCYYNFDETNNFCGKLYNWYAISDKRGIAPNGWHVPTTLEWKELITYYGGTKETSQNIKSTGGWKFDGNGNNSSGFTALPCGRLSISVFMNMGLAGYWFSSKGDEPFYTESVSLSYTGKLEIGTEFTKNGFSVRYCKERK